MSKIIIHIDMDAFFASIEELDHPEYKGKPLAVGADPKGGKGRGVLSTCNYEARKYGLHSAMPVSRAYFSCPHAIFVQPRMSRYKFFTKKIFSILNDFTPIVEPISIDEAFMDITGCTALFGPPVEIAQKIKKRIQDEVKLTASIGIAPIKFVAKIASDLEKPNGLVIVKQENLLEFLWPLPISKMWGVGKKTEDNLKKYGIKTIGDLANIPQKKIIKLLGKTGLHFWNLANGKDSRDVQRDDSVKSVSLEHTFNEDVENSSIIKQTIFSISDNVSRILRKKNLKGKTITLKIRLEDFSTFTRSQSQKEFIDSSKIINQITSKIFDNFKRDGKKVRLIGIAVSNLNSSSGEQLGLFEKTDKKNKKIDEVIDLIQEKFGPGLIKKASILDHYSRRIDSATDDKSEIDNF